MFEQSQWPPPQKTAQLRGNIDPAGVSGKPPHGWLNGKHDNNPEDLNEWIYFTDLNESHRRGWFPLIKHNFQGSVAVRSLCHWPREDGPGAWFSNPSGSSPRRPPHTYAFQWGQDSFPTHTVGNGQEESQHGILRVAGDGCEYRDVWQWCIHQLLPGPSQTLGFRATLRSTMLRQSHIRGHENLWDAIFINNGNEWYGISNHTLCISQL